MKKATLPFAYYFRTFLHSCATNGTSGWAPIFTIEGLSSLISASRCSGGSGQSRVYSGHRRIWVTIPGLAAAIAASAAGISGRSTPTSLLGAWTTITASRTPAKFC
jgi:hypothetical protein